MESEAVQTKIDQMIADGVKIPSLPAIAVRILNAVQQDELSLNDLAKIITSDPALTAKLLLISANEYVLRSSLTFALIGRAKPSAGFSASSVCLIAHLNTELNNTRYLLTVLA